MHILYSWYLFTLLCDTVYLRIRFLTGSTHIMTAQQVADSGRLGTVIGNGHMLTSGMTHLSTGISWLLPFDLLAKTPSGMLVFYILMGLTLLCVRISIHQPLPRMRKNHDPIRDFIACVAVLLIYKLQHTVSNWYYIFPPVRISLNLNSKQQIVWLRFPHYLSSSSTSRLNLAKIWWNGTDLFWARWWLTQFRTRLDGFDKTAGCTCVVSG